MRKLYGVFFLAVGIIILLPAIMLQLPLNTFGTFLVGGSLIVGLVMTVG